MSKELTQTEVNKVSSASGKYKNIPIERLLELRRKGLTFREIAKIVSCQPSNVSRRLKDYEGYIDFKNHTDRHYEYLLKQIKDSIDLKDIKKASLHQKVVCMGILHDKIMQLRGKSQHNMSIRAAILDLERDMKVAIEVKVENEPVVDIS